MDINKPVDNSSLSSNGNNNNNDSNNNNNNPKDKKERRKKNKEQEQMREERSLARERAEELDENGQPIVDSNKKKGNWTYSLHTSLTTLSLYIIVDIICSNGKTTNVCVLRYDDLCSAK